MAAGIYFEMKTEIAIFIAAGLAVASLCAVSFLALFRANHYSGQPCAEERADEFEDAFCRWVHTRQHPTTRFDDCQPKAENYGITEQHAERIRKRIIGEIERAQ